MRQARISGMARRAHADNHGDQRGFTLVEMLVVITIIGLIMGLIGPRVLSYLGESKVKTARIQLQSFGSALDLFYLDAGRYPSTAEGLAACGRPAAWRAGRDRISRGAMSRTIPGTTPMFIDRPDCMGLTISCHTALMGRRVERILLRISPWKPRPAPDNE
jgi:type II secretion system protein G